MNTNNETMTRAERNCLILLGSDAYLYEGSEPKDEQP